MVKVYVRQALVLAVIAVFGFAVGSYLRLSTATPPEASAAPGMTYRGMTIEDFSSVLDLSVDDPYLVALFEDLCRVEEAELNS
ncbi:MAG: hypothetical protein AAF576_09580 [Pseudomonadota bacterium]